ncbi:MAG: RagB/SusD family nutrient uptake outer membrane protein [Bacteroidales bacterium]|nr:RagB/SusD family nutrient uptake outer membrane protein [Bacteroidales bacterium]
MKSLKIFSFAVAVVVMLSSCSASWLDTQTNGSTLTQDQFDALTNPTEGLVNGLYSLLYVSNGDHHYFGQKSIDMATDLLSSDMAMTLNAYGWFTDAATRTCSTASSGRNSYIWSYYYTIIMNANTAIRKMAPRQNEFTDDELAVYAQALTLRAYCYYNLATLYNPGLINDETADIFVGGTGLGYSSIPIYTENDTTETGLIKEQYVSSVGEAYEFAINDLRTAIAFFDSVDFVRMNKLIVDADVARGLLAYCYLEDQQYDKAYQTAKELIDSRHFSIIPYDNVLTTGFVSVEDNSWMWGSDVTIETTTGLASFWGHMDIHTYSYASAGATKAIDDQLFELIPRSDIRRQWFDTTKKFINDYKFYDKARGVLADELDRRWLNDLVYMRIEEMYLIGAEAAYRDNQIDNSKDLLKELLLERDKDLASEVDGMSSGALREQIYYNWRVEMWGEGRALATYKRFGGRKTRGNNHYNGAGEEVSVTDIRLTFQTPNGEINTNSTFFPDKEEE